MIDREKVIKGLECCRNLNPPDDWGCPEECPYSIESNPHRCCAFDPLLNDALALLQEQEPVQPKEQEETRTWTVCGNCSQHLISKWSHCPYCGRKINWE